MNIVIVGGSGGIGQAFVKHIATQPHVQSIHATYYHTQPLFSHHKVNWERVDVTNESSIQAWLEQIDEIDWLINAVGILHRSPQGPEKTVRMLDSEFFLQNVMINTMPTLLLAKNMHKKFRHGRPAIFATISARVGSITDNYLGGWYSYRASKAALNMCIKTLSIEWQRTLPNVTVAALHPGTTDTALSKPFQKNVPPEQLFSPAQSVGYMMDVLNNLKPVNTGKLWAFDGELLPW
jgi:NAD(P)-dependent dehydrogenase (short-subunit alcohol dehydrogenase family)